MFGGRGSLDLFSYEFPELPHRDGHEHGGVRGLGCRGGLVHGGQSCALHSISVPQVHFLIIEVLGVSGSLMPNSSNWAGVSSWLITRARSTGPSLASSSRRVGTATGSSCRCTLQRLGIPHGQSGVEDWTAESSCTGDALSLSVRVGPTVSLYVSFLYLSLQLYGWYVGLRLGLGGFLS